MSYADFDRRLRRIEADRRGSAPTLILSDRPMPEPGEPDPLASALANWRAWIADGRASVRSGILWITGPEMTMQAWEARFVTEH